MARKTKRKYPSKKVTKLMARRKSVRFIGGLGLDQNGEEVSFSEPGPSQLIGVEQGIEEGGRKTRKHKRKFKKVLCSPAKKNNIASSCYSASELVTIKNAFKY
jgi:hypothetical protein